MPTHTSSPHITVHARPDVTRADAGIVAVTEFDVGGADEQQRLFDASRAAWQTLPWPETLLAISWLASLDGQRALAYVQWRDDSGFEAFGRTHRPVLSARLRESVPELQAPPAVLYRRYRSGAPAADAEPGCIVAIAVEFDGPDEARLKTWIDTVFDALAAESAPPAGAINGHFHVSLDGTRVLNIAEWVDEASHIAALERAGNRAIGSSAKWRDVLAFPGLKGSRVTRYRVSR
jgi:hypothetical protein